LNGELVVKGWVVKNCPGNAGSTSVLNSQSGECVNGPGPTSQNATCPRKSGGGGSGGGGGSPTTQPSTNAAVCFHESSELRLFDGTKVTKDLLPAGRCVVPHFFSNIQGIVVTTTCSKTVPLRLTHDHLVYTSRGLLPASKIQVHDIVYQDFAETQICHVLSTAEETGNYFGLNCADDFTVLANGIKTSTFGYSHVIPSLWLKVASCIVGIQRASLVGDAIVSWLYANKVI